MISESETRDRQKTRGEGKIRQRQPKRRHYIRWKVMDICFFYTKIAREHPKAIRTLNNGDAGDSKCKVR